MSLKPSVSAASLISHLVEVEQLGLRETARRLQVDSRTINRYVQRLGLTAKWRSHNETQNSVATEVTYLKPMALTIAKPNIGRPGVPFGASTLRLPKPHSAAALLPPISGLHHNSPLAQRPVYENNRVNWQTRDEHILAQVQEAVQKLLAAEKPIRITVSKVAKAIGQLALTEQHLDQMPLTKVYLDAVVESIEDY